MADPRPVAPAVVATDALRVTVLRPGLMRLQTRAEPQTAWDDRPSLQIINRRVLPVPPFTTAHSDKGLNVTSAAMSVLLSTNGSMSVRCSGRDAYSWSMRQPPMHDFETLVNAAGMYILDDAYTTRLVPGSTAVIPWIDRNNQRSGQTDYYAFCYGRDFSSALSMLSDVTGPAPLMNGSSATAKFATSRY